MDGRKFKWTPERTALLKNRYCCRVSVADIARELGCSESAVYNKAYSLHLSRNRRREFRLVRYTQEQFDLVRKNYPRMSRGTLSALSGVKITAIKKWAYVFRWRKDKQYWSDCRQWREKNRKTRMERWRQENADRVRQYSAHYRATHREQIREQQRKYRERKRSLAESEAAPAREC